MIYFCGNSIRGQKHLEVGLPNQDSYKFYNSRKCSCAVVSDGLGSKRKSDYGSKQVCKIAIKLLKKISQNKLDMKGFLELLTTKWLEKTKKYDSKNCDATCLFALVTKEYCFLGQLGDGMLSCVVDGKLFVVKGKDDDFLNETTSIYKSTLKDWVIKKIDFDGHKITNIFMTTDGISNDLIDGQTQPFINEISANLKKNCVFGNNKHIKNVLLSMPNINNSDDKTIVLGRNYEQ